MEAHIHVRLGIVVHDARRIRLHALLDAEGVVHGAVHRAKVDVSHLLRDDAQFVDELSARRTFLWRYK